MHTVVERPYITFELVVCVFDLQSNTSGQSQHQNKNGDGKALTAGTEATTYGVFLLEESLEKGSRILI